MPHRALRSGKRHVRNGSSRWSVSLLGIALSSFGVVACGGDDPRVEDDEAADAGDSPDADAAAADAAPDGATPAPCGAPYVSAAGELLPCIPCGISGAAYALEELPATISGTTGAEQRVASCNAEGSQALVAFVPEETGVFEFVSEDPTTGFTVIVGCELLTGCATDARVRLEAGQEALVVVESTLVDPVPFSFRARELGERVECAGVRCPALGEFNVEVIEQCCTADAACGVRIGGACLPRDAEGPPNSQCPPAHVEGQIVRGCCLAGGSCGLDLSVLDSGCIDREEVLGMSVGRIACGEQTPPRYTNFESGHVRPLALSPDGSRLFAVNTPAATLEILTVTSSGLEPSATIPVGLEPVAVAARTAGEVWVVNHLSDSISVVDVDASPPRVVRTLWTGDEPRDIVFGGRSRDRAFVTTAHRGQNHPVDPQFFTPGIGRADVWVFDAQNPGGEAGGQPLEIINLFGDTPRALAASPDGSAIFAAVFHSGNRTTVLHDSLVPEDLRPPPIATQGGVSQPAVGLVVRHDGRDWVDETGHVWTDSVRFSLPDYDVFRIDADADPPVATGRVSGVGTTIFNLAVNPATGVVYASNSEARNHVRFEPVLRGHFADSRITVIDGESAKPLKLNAHADYAQPGTARDRTLALSQPLGMEVSADGARLYLAAYGTGRVAVFETASLASGSTAEASARIAVSGGGPTGLALDEVRRRLYVATRFDNGISIVDLDGANEVGHLTLYNPEPEAIREGRPFLYDATRSSSHGDSACGGCHIFGDTDHLAWDLGDPDGEPFIDPGGGGDFHPMKGPLLTQSLRGLANHGPLHWRADRTGAAEPGGSHFDTVRAFHQFNPAFVSLLGRDNELSREDMQRFADFVMTLSYPPNPIRALDNGLTSRQAAAQEIYFNQFTDGTGACGSCHLLDPQAGFFGTNLLRIFDGMPQEFKIPHLRAEYQKVGMFGIADNGFHRGTGFTGEQIRGFGYLHDGAVDTLVTFFESGVFTMNADEARLMAEYVLAFDQELAPVVGQQITVTSAMNAASRARLDLLAQQARVTTPRPACDLIAKGVVGGRARGYRGSIDGAFRSDRREEATRTLDELLALLGDGDVLTFTCTPPGSGERLGVDRDLDGTFDGDAAP